MKPVVFLLDPVRCQREPEPEYPPAYRLIWPGRGSEWVPEAYISESVRLPTLALVAYKLAVLTPPPGHAGVLR